MAKTIYIGIDPGKSGGIAYILNGKMYAHKFPKDLRNIVEILKNLKQAKCLCAMELVHSFPGQGVVSTFSFGENFGMWKGMLTAFDIEYKLVTPRIWMRFYGELPKEKSLRKKKLKEIAKELYNDIKVTLYTADAILITHYLKEIANEKSKDT
mgnify:CR=1 FL=1